MNLKRDNREEGGRVGISKTKESFQKMNQSIISKVHVHVQYNGSHWS